MAGLLPEAGGDRLIGVVKKSPLDWDWYYMNIAGAVSEGSKDPNRKVGAVLVTPDKRQLSIGYNGFPPEVPDLKAHLRDQTYKRQHMVHAECNCLRQAPFPTDGCTLYVTRFTCSECAEQVLEKKVARVVAPAPDFDHAFWGSSWKAAEEKLAKAGVAITYLHFTEIPQ